MHKPALNPQTVRLIEEARRRRQQQESREEPESELDRVSEDLSDLSEQMKELELLSGTALQELSGKSRDDIVQLLNGHGRTFFSLLREFESTQATREELIARELLGWHEELSLEEALDSIMKALEDAREVLGSNEAVENLIFQIYDRFDAVVDWSHGERGPGDRDVSDFFLSDENIGLLFLMRVFQPGDVEELYKTQQIYGADHETTQYRPEKLNMAIRNVDELRFHLQIGTFNSELEVALEKLSVLHPDLSREELHAGVTEMIHQLLQKSAFVQESESLSGLLLHLSRVVRETLEEHWDPDTEEASDGAKAAVMVLKRIFKRLNQSRRICEQMDRNGRSSQHFLAVLEGLDDEQYGDLLESVRQATPTSKLTAPQRGEQGDLSSDDLRRFLDLAHQLPPEDEQEGGVEDDGGLDDWPGWED